MGMTIVALIVSLASVEAMADGPNGKCYIYLSAPCHNNLAYGPQSGWFLDSDPMAQSNAARCVQRAAEYYGWCGDPLKIQNAFSAFNVILQKGETNIQIAVKNVNGSYISGPGSLGYLGVVYTHQ